MILYSNTSQVMHVKLLTQSMYNLILYVPSSSNTKDHEQNSHLVLLFLSHNRYRTKFGRDLFGKKYRGQLQVEQRLLYLGSLTIKSGFLLKSVLKFRGGRGSPFSLMKRKEKQIRVRNHLIKFI